MVDWEMLALAPEAVARKGHVVALATLTGATNSTALHDDRAHAAGPAILGGWAKSGGAGSHSAGRGRHRAPPW